MPMRSADRYRMGARTGGVANVPREAHFQTFDVEFA